MRFSDYLEEKSKLVNERLDYYFPQIGNGIPILRESMRYSLMAGGKRLRPVLCILGYELAGGKDLERILPPACALEMIHTFTLIHDDLPAMDNDDLRRGLPTNHRVYGEAMAILAGDALFIEAIGLFLMPSMDDSQKVKMLSELVQALGVDGVIGGQVLDIKAEGKVHSRRLAENIHLRKTAKFIEASLVIGGVGAGAETEFLEKLRFIGNKLGLLFQVVDDILDEVGEEDEIGKKAHKDRERGKCTYPSVMGLESATEYAKMLVKEVGDYVEANFPEAEILADAANFFLSRRK
ncbi:MAG: polyprenyl synthetase family protein [candidate division WOR-3 bacterium]